MTVEIDEAHKGAADGSAAESSTENKPEGDEQKPDAGGEGDKKPAAGADEFKDLPFHEHPRWKQREKEWNEKFEKQEQSITERISAAIAAANKPQTPKEDEKVSIPEWFGGDEKQWKAYLADQKRIIEEAENRAFERYQKGQSSQTQAVQEANKWFEDSVLALEAESGKKIDRNALLKVVLDNELIDSKGRWNYRAGYKILAGTAPAPDPKPNKGAADRKILAAATTGKESGKGEGEGKAFTTSEDFKNPSKRPW